jgi:restriction endonuclease S subunit
MKDSGVEWIGEIPESWDTCKLKYAVECRTEKTVDKSASVAYIGLEHVKSDFGVLVDEYEHIWDFEGDTIDFKAGDVLFGKLRPYLAKAWAASFNGKCSSEFWVMTPVKLTSKFLLYTVLSNHFIANIDHSTFGVKMPRAEWEYAGNQLICCPSIAEQENITEYLDLKCSEIDSLISENAESIEMLKEYRQSVIYEAVTGKVEKY